ncbi:hypothetical protein [Halocatena halophila]|uniref:hypothetical protein n=1 Tax=Halocatena halophila TaxID=2814576 RepID=UPI002ED64E86
MVTLGARALEPFERFSRYNSPYPAHDRGCAIDLYPPAGEHLAHSPVSGRVTDVREVAGPASTAEPTPEFLVVIDTGAWLARILHVEPSVEPGMTVAVGDPIGQYVRSGFFDPWVAQHIHLGFRSHDANPYRAEGSEPIDLDVDVQAIDWDGTGTVIETTETAARLAIESERLGSDSFVGLTLQSADGQRMAIDGGLAHYSNGGWCGLSAEPPPQETPVSFLGRPIGTCDDRTLEWNTLTVVANGRQITGLSCFLTRSTPTVKLVCPAHTFAVGETVSVQIQPL